MAHAIINVTLEIRVDGDATDEQIRADIENALENGQCFYRNDHGQVVRTVYRVDMNNE